MKTIEAKIERATDGTFSVYCLEEMFSGVGDTIEEAKEDMQAQIEFYVEHCKEGGKAYPDWLDEDYRIEYQLDVPSILQYYEGVITPAALGRLSGINPKQIWNYAHGKSKPRPAQLEKIQMGLRKLAAELSAISLL